MEGKKQCEMYKKVKRNGWNFCIVPDEKIQDNNFPDGILASELAKIGKIYYNFSKYRFGYGDDPYDWENWSDEWIEVQEMTDEGENLGLWF